MKSRLKTSLTRREAAVLGVAAVFPWGSLPVIAGAGRNSRDHGLTVGVSTLGFNELTNEQLAQELSKKGIHTVQLFLNQIDSRYWRYNHRCDLSEMSPARCRAIADHYRQVGISVHSLGVYTNLIHPDESEREANLAFFEGMMKIAQEMEVRVLVTEAGHYRSNQPEPDVAYHFQEEVWKRMVALAQRLSRLAERYAATILFEPFYRGFLASAKRTRLFLEAVASPRVRALLDPANLLEVNDLEEMFNQLSPWIDCLHAKDRILHIDQGVAAGQGDLDYVKFVTLAAKHTPHAPLILEYVGSKDYQSAWDYVRRALSQAGLNAQ